MQSKATRQQRIGTRRPALARHVHVDGYVRALRVVHDVSDVIVVHLRLPRLQSAVLKQMFVRQRGDKGLGLRHVHVQSRIAHVSGTIEDERCLCHVMFSQSDATIHKRIDLLKL